MMVILSFLLPEDLLESALPQKPTQLTLNRIGLGQLAEVGEELFRNVVPGLALAETEVDMGTGQLVYVKLLITNEHREKGSH